MNIAIIDDEKKARRLLRTILEDCPEVEQIQEAEDLPSGAQLIKKMSPDLVFLDIEMPNYSGIQIFDFINPDEVNFDLVFATAYSQYAIQAFELNAMDYILKPLRFDQVEAIVKKSKEKKSKSQIKEQLMELKNCFESSTIRKIAFPVSDGILFVDVKEIILLEAERMYTHVYTLNDGDFLVSKPMKFFTDHLQQAQDFFKPHRSFIINLNHVKKIVTKDGGAVLMDNGKSVSIVKEKKKELIDIFSRM